MKKIIWKNKQRASSRSRLDLSLFGAVASESTKQLFLPPPSHACQHHTHERLRTLRTSRRTPGSARTSPTTESFGSTAGACPESHSVAPPPCRCWPAACPAVFAFPAPADTARSWRSGSCFHRRTVSCEEPGTLNRVHLDATRTTYLKILIRLSNSFRLYSTSPLMLSSEQPPPPSSPQDIMILLSISVTNIWLSRNCDRKGRWCCGWSDRKDALSKLCIDSRLLSQSSRAWNGWRYFVKNWVLKKKTQIKWKCV